MKKSDEACKFGLSNMADRSAVACYIALAVVVFSCVQVYNSGIRIHRQWNHQLKAKVVRINSVKDQDGGQGLKINQSEVFEIKSLKLFISGAYLDSRYGHFAVRLPVLHEVARKYSLICMFKVGEQIFPSQVDIDEVFPTWPPDSNYTAALLSCTTPRNQKIDYSEVFVVDQFHYGHLSKDMLLNSNEADGARHFVRVPLLKPQPRMAGQHHLAICLKATDAFPQPNLLLEWFEFYRQYGVSHFYMYDASITTEPETTKILEFYQSINILSLIRFPFAQKVPEDISWRKPLDKAQAFSVKQQIQLVSINDCFYRFHDKVRQFLLVDLDELLIPSRDEDLLELSHRAFKDYPDYGNILFQNSWYFANQQSTDTRNHTKFFSFFDFEKPVRTMASEKQPKGIVQSSAARTLNWHCIIHLHESVSFKSFTIINPIDYGLIHHFRNVCEEKFHLETCQNLAEKSVQDSFLLNYKQVVTERVQQVRKKHLN